MICMHANYKVELRNIWTNLCQSKHSPGARRLEKYIFETNNELQKYYLEQTFDGHSQCGSMNQYSIDKNDKNRNVYYRLP